MTNVVAYRGHQNPVWDVDWSHMGIYFTTASRDRTARLWSTDRTSTLRIYAGHSSDVDVSTRKCPRLSETHSKQCVRFHPNSLYIATGSSDWTARLWDVQRGTSVRVFIGHQGIVSTLAFSPDGRYLATTGNPIPTTLENLLNGSPLGEDLSINLWDLGSGRRIKKMTGHTASVYSLAFSAESSVLVSGGADWTVRCWDFKGAGGPPETSRTNGIGGSHGSHPHHSKDPGPEVIETWVVHHFHIASVSWNHRTDLLATFPTKRTPITTVHFTPRNLCLVAGPYLSTTPR
jgi:transcription initiation factor TFIID subunit 5